MTLVVVSAAFFLGLLVGSFLNVVIRRGFKGEPLTGRSHCESCRKTLSPQELIPIISFFIQKGRCRNCDAKISWQYPIVEASTGVLYAIAAWYFLQYFVSSNPWSLVLGHGSLVALGLSAAIVIFTSDFLYEIIPDGAVIILFILGVVAGVLRGSLLQDGIAALAIASVFAAFWFFSRGRLMGFGDAKLSLATSLLLGYPVSISALLFSFWLGGLAGAMLLVLRIKKPQDHLPFGPFILMGSAAAFFFSQKFLLYAGINSILW